MKKQPEVTEKTRQRLMDSFWQLYKENRIEKITVGSITKLAGLNRGTFYEYFTDIYELLDQLEDELIENVRKELDSRRILEEKESGIISHEMITRYTLECAKVFTEYDDKLHIFLSQKGDPAFRVKLKEQLWMHLSEIMDMRQMKESDENKEYVLSFILSSLTGFFDCWYEMGKQTPIEELLEKMQTLIFRGVFGYYGVTIED